MCDDKRLKSITAIVKAEKNFNFRIFRNITGEKTLLLQTLNCHPCLPQY